MNNALKLHSYKNKAYLKDDMLSREGELAEEDGPLPTTSVQTSCLPCRRSFRKAVNNSVFKTYDTCYTHCKRYIQLVMP